jgi:hypothetical protein
MAQPAASPSSDTGINDNLIPAALRQRRAEVQAKHQDPANDTQDDAPAQSDSNPFDASAYEVPTDLTPPAVQTKTAPAADEGDEQSWAHRYKTLQGMYRSEKTKLAVLEDEVAALKEALQARKSVPSPVAPTPSDAPITLTAKDVPAQISAEEMEQYKRSAPVIKHLAFTVLQEAIAPVLQRLAALERGVTEVKTSTQQTVAGLADKSFKGQLRQAVPDLDALTASADFKTFLERPIPYSGGQTIRDRLKQAYEGQDAHTIASIVADFRASTGGGKPPVTPAHFQQPAGNGGQPPAAREPQPQQGMLAWSKRKEATERFRKGMMSQAELTKVQQLYDQAAKDGRVDYDK